MPESLVLDACTLTAYFRKEPGCELVSTRFMQAADGELTILLHKITFTEVVYDTFRTDKEKTFSDVQNDVHQLPIVIVDTLTDAFVEQAAVFKASYKISFADCFVLALGKLMNARVLTSDHHEFDAIEKTGELTFEWIR